MYLYYLLLQIYMVLIVKKKQLARTEIMASFDVIF
jgi:hypothetical protein